MHNVSQTETTVTVSRTLIAPIWVWVVLAALSGLGVSIHGGAGYWYYTRFGDDLLWKLSQDVVYVWDRPVALVDWHLGFGYDVGWIPISAHVAVTWVDFVVYAVLSFVMWYGIVVLVRLVASALKRRLELGHAG